MRTALFLLLLLAIAAVPGSLVPQRSSDPNGVTQYTDDNPDLAAVIDALQGFDVYTSVWFSSIYLLLFISLIGCVIPRLKHHVVAMASRPPATPSRLARMPVFIHKTLTLDVSDPSHAEAELEQIGHVVHTARDQLSALGYRVASYGRETHENQANGTPHRLFGRGTEPSVSAERGYLRETGNLLFHAALVGVLIAVAVGGSFGFSGQRVVVEGQTFVNTLGDYDSFSPGRFFSDTELHPYALTLEDLDARYEQDNTNALGQPLDYTASVLARIPHASGETVENRIIKVNDPLQLAGTSVYLLGNGYAPRVTIRSPDGTVVFHDAVPFLPQDANLTSVGIIKVPDGLREQVGLVGFFYPTQGAKEPPYFSSYPALELPVLTLNVFTGDLGINEGIPASVYALKVDTMTAIAGSTSSLPALELMPGQTVSLPNGLGTVTFENNATKKDVPGDEKQRASYALSVPRFASFDIHHDPSQLWVLLAAIAATGGLIVSLLIPRRRVWVKVIPRNDGTVTIEYAGLSRGEDPGLRDAVLAVANRHATILAQSGLSLS